MKPSDLGYKLLADGIRLDTVKEFLTVYTQQPDMYRAFVAEVRRLKSFGERRSSQWIFDNLRRNPGLVCGSGGFKVDNTLSPCFSRAVEWQEQDLRGFFKLKGDKRRMAA